MGRCSISLIFTGIGVSLCVASLGAGDPTTQPTKRPVVFSSWPEESTGQQITWSGNYGYSGAPIQSYDMTVRFLGTQQIDGFTCTKISTEHGYGRSDRRLTTNFERADDTGVYERESDRSPEYCTMPLPLHIGDSWVYHNSNGLRECAVVGVEDVTIADKTYKDCAIVLIISRSGERTLVTRFDLCPTAGPRLVRIQSDGGSSGWRYHAELLLTASE